MGDFSADLELMMAWGPEAVLSLADNAELTRMDAWKIDDILKKNGISWYWLPLAPGGAPDSMLEQRWSGISESLKALLRRGGKLLIHGMEGRGRPGMMAARLLMDLGCAPQDAINRVRAARPGAIEDGRQLEYLFSAGLPRSSAHLSHEETRPRQTKPVGKATPAAPSAQADAGTAILPAWLMPNVS
jgi:protein-tyrosine phosphatase